MYIITYIELDVVSLLMCLLICFQQKPKGKTDFFGGHYFNRMLGLTMVILILNILAWIIEGCIPHTGSHAHMIIMAAFFFCQTVLPLELLRYCIDACNYRIRRWLSALLALPVAINGALLVINLAAPFAYHINESHSYERLFLFPAIIIAPLLYIIASIAMCAVRCVKSASYERDMALKLLAFTLSIFGSSILSALVYGFSPWPIVALGLVYLYLNVHSKQTKELGLLAYKDALTGVRNATAYSFLTKELDAKIQSGSAEFSIVVADVNNLKAVNDCFGHNAGDQLLIHAARLICRIFDHSPVHRIGGDEFAIVLEGSDYKNRDLLIKRLSREMTYAGFTLDGRKHCLSIAIGIVDYDPRVHARSADVFQAADQAMYVNKIRRKRGR